MGGLCRYTRASRGTSVVTSALHAPPSTSTTRIGTTGTRWTFGSGRVVSLDRSARAWSSPVGADSAIRTCCPPYVRPPTPVGAEAGLPAWTTCAGLTLRPAARRVCPPVGGVVVAGWGWMGLEVVVTRRSPDKLAARGHVGHDNVRRAGNDVVEEGLRTSFSDQYDVGIEFVGSLVPGGDQLIVRGDLGSLDAGQSLDDGAVPGPDPQSPTGRPVKARRHRKAARCICNSARLGHTADNASTPVVTRAATLTTSTAT